MLDWKEGQYVTIPKGCKYGGKTARVERIVYCRGSIIGYEVIHNRYRKGMTINCRVIVNARADEETCIR